jgi:hypothetical protein
MNLNSKIASVPTGQILTRLIHPSVFAAAEIKMPLGEPATVVDSEKTSYTYTGAKGRILVRNDGVRVLIEAWCKEDKILMCAIRDRQLDGTDKSSPLTFYPNQDPACNRLPAPDFTACELSIYSWDPATYLDGFGVVGTLGHFIADPDFYTWKTLPFNPDQFFPLWAQAFHIGRGPWQTARPMKGVPQFFVDGAIALCKELGYHRVDAVPSWFNVARFFEKWNFKFTYGEHEVMYRTLLEGLNEFGEREGNSALTRTQESWLVTLQNIPETMIPDELKLAARWPVTHTNTYWVRMHLDLNPYVAVTTPKLVVPAAASDLMAGIRKMRVESCSDEVHVKVSSRRSCDGCDTLGQSSPGATSPKATTPEN